MFYNEQFLDYFSSMLNICSYISETNALHSQQIAKKNKKYLLGIERFPSYKDDFFSMPKYLLQWLHINVRFYIFLLKKE